MPSPSDEPVDARPEMRWHPLRGEWVIYAAHRLNRTFLPPPEYNPLARPPPTREHPTELPRGRYDMAVFDNRFPSLSLSAPQPEAVPGTDTAPRHRQMRGGGVQPGRFRHAGRVARRAASSCCCNIWADRTTRLAAGGVIKSVLAFENRGVEVGVTLHHPHGQLYAYDHIPPVQARMLESAQAYQR